MNINKQFIEDNYSLIQYVVSKVGKNLNEEGREDLAHDVVVAILSSNVKAKHERASALINTVVRNLLLNDIRDSQVDMLGHCGSLDQPVIEKNGEVTTMHELIEGTISYDPDNITDKSNSFLPYANDVEDLCRYLNPTYGKYFKMRYLLGYTPAEISRICGAEGQEVRNALRWASKQAFELTQVIPAVKGIWDGLTLREMVLRTLPDHILYPFKLRYCNSKSLLDILHLTGKSLQEVRQLISQGEKIIYERYGVDVHKR